MGSSFRLAPESASSASTHIFPSNGLASPAPPWSDPPAGQNTQHRVFDTTEGTLDIHGITLRVLSIRDTNALIDRISPEEFAVDERLPFWAEVWPSSLVLGEYCLRTFKRQPSLSILELGTGLGVTGICAVLAGANVLMTDYEPDALLFARYNLMQNIPDADVWPRVRVRLLDWRRPDLDEQFDFVIGSDILYDRKHFTPILDLLPFTLRPGGLAVFTDPCRSTLPDFLSQARSRGLLPDVEEVRLGGRTIARVDLPRGRQ
jgi:predicted nicotinamide N-methyase